jgi:hypothetical protein
MISGKLPKFVTAGKFVGMRQIFEKFPQRNNEMLVVVVYM